MESLPQRLTCSEMASVLWEYYFFDKGTGPAGGEGVGGYFLVASGAVTWLGSGEVLNAFLSPPLPLQVLVPNLPPSPPFWRASLFSLAPILPSLLPSYFLLSSLFSRFPCFPSRLPSISAFSQSPLSCFRIFSLFLGCFCVPLWLSLPLSVSPSPSPVTSCSAHLELSFFFSSQMLFSRP